MLNIIRQPDDILVSTDSHPLSRDFGDIKVRFEQENRSLKTFVYAKTEKPKFICLRWNYKTQEPIRVMGDKWERAYADLFWSSINPEQFMPWYFFISNGTQTTGIGVKVRPNSFVSFEYDDRGVTAWVDVRCGAMGVDLNGRELHACTFVNESYSGISSFNAAVEFCKVMSPDPILPKEPVYGSNNWYYAYGESSREQILKDSEFVASLAKGLSNRPYMVIDDGWTEKMTEGPWIPNDKFGNMGTLAQEIKAKGVKPGIWVRLLADPDLSLKNPEWQLKRDCQNYTPPIDPSHPVIKDYLRETLRRIRGWGYELLKHDYSTCDLFEGFGLNFNGMITKEENWSFYDKCKTSAEITLDFYRLIREETEGMVLIGCDTIPHLCAGLVEINRVGDDTSSKSWSRTRAFGINSLAFRLPQNKNFYMVDADCVCIFGDYIPWEMNRQWLDLLARSGTPLFVSCDPASATHEMIDDIKKAFKIASVSDDIAEPLDWEYNKNPSLWLINDKKTEYDWISNCYPILLKGKVPPIASPDNL